MLVLPAGHAATVRSAECSGSPARVAQAGDSADVILQVIDAPTACESAERL